MNMCHAKLGTYYNNTMIEKITYKRNYFIQNKDNNVQSL